MEVKQKILYLIDQKRKFEENFLYFLQNLDDFEILKKSSEMERIRSNKNDLHVFLKLLFNISCSHKRSPQFFTKIEQIILYLKENIKQSYSNTELYYMSRCNKVVLLILISNDIIIIDKLIVENITSMLDFRQFFYPEIKHFLDENQQKQIEREMLENNPNIFDNYDEKRKKGENDSYLSSLIRNDSIQEFVIYISRTNINPKNEIISLSCFESNDFLLPPKKVTLIEYAFFYGSIRIIKYLHQTEVELKPSLWLYAIHGRNSSAIHILEENKILLPKKACIFCLKEAIRCHHNEIAFYIQVNYFHNSQIPTNIYEGAIQNYNYQFFPDDITNQIAFFNFYVSEYYDLVDLLIEMKKEEIEAEIIQRK